VAFIDSIKEQMMRRAGADRLAQERAIREMAGRRVDRRAEELAGRNTETMSRDIAQFLNRGARGGVDLDDVVDSPDYANYDVVRQMVGGQAINPAEVGPEQIRGAVQGLGQARRGAVARGMALSEGPGAMERLVGMQSRVSGLLASKGLRGDAARVGVATGAIGGGVMGLTAAGQGLMALMAYMQEGQQTAVERNNELA
jgi:hypothetical protein